MQTSVSPIVQTTRSIAAGIGIFFGMAAFGCMLLAIGGQAVLGPMPTAYRVGDVLAIGCLSAGIALAAYLWWTWAREPILFKNFNVVALGNAVMTAGLALYSNLVYGIWALGMPMSIGTVADGRMGEHYWLGPFTLAYAVVGYLFMKMCIRKHRD